MPRHFVICTPNVANIKKQSGLSIGNDISATFIFIRCKERSRKRLVTGTGASCVCFASVRARTRMELRNNGNCIAQDNKWE